MARWFITGNRRTAAWYGTAAVITLGASAWLAPTLASAAPAGAAETASSGTWTAKRLPLPPNALSNSFQPLAVSCASTLRCAGGGTYAVGGKDYQAAVLNWSGRKWKAAQAPLPAPSATIGQDARLASISCPSATTCFAGGVYQAGHGGAYGMLLTWSGGKWSATKAPVPAGSTNNPDNVVTGISCPSTRWCRAVSQNGGGSGGLVLRWAGRRWKTTVTPTPTGAVSASLYAISCPSLTLCVAGGSYADSIAHTFPLIVTWSGSAWTDASVPLPAGAGWDPQAVVSGVSCPSTTRCVAVGRYVDSAGNAQGMVLTWSGKGWHTKTAPLPADAASNPWAFLNAVSCPTATRCTAGGQYTNTATQPVGLLLTWSGRRWKPAAAPAIAYDIQGMSCPSSTRCVALSWGNGRPVVLTGP